MEYVSRRRASYAFLLRGGIGADAEVAQIVEETRQAVLNQMVSRLSRFGADPAAPATRLRLRGWLGFLETASLDWAEREDMELETFLELLVQMAGAVFAAILNPTEP